MENGTSRAADSRARPAAIANKGHCLESWLSKLPIAQHIDRKLVSESVTSAIHKLSADGLLNPSKDERRCLTRDDLLYIVEGDILALLDDNENPNLDVNASEGSSIVHSRHKHYLNVSGWPETFLQRP